MATDEDSPSRRPAGIDDDLVEAVGKASEALEYVERARGYLYTFHQLIGHADLVFGEAADLLASTTASDDAQELNQELVGRNVLDGRWTYQIVEEFDDGYYAVAVSMVRALERRHMGGARHVYEDLMKERRRSAGRSGHERRPAAVHGGVESTDS